MASVVSCKLIELNAETTNALVTAIVLSKSEPNFFLARDANEYRGVITYTVRDSQQHIVNVKFWGSKEKVQEHQRNLKIGDIIDVICPKVLPQIGFGTNAAGTSLAVEQYMPQPTLHYTLVLNEGESFLDKHNPYRDSNFCHELRKLLHVPHRPLCGALNLADVRCSDSEKPAQAQFVDLLVLLAALRPIKELKSARNGQMINCLEVVVFDRSLPGGMTLTIWNSDWIHHAQQYWLAMKTVLYLIDVKVSYSDFYKSSNLTLTGRSLIYENPIGKETQLLLDYGVSVPTKDYDIFAQDGMRSLPKADEITQQMSVKQIYARAEGNLKDSAEQFTAVLYAMVTKFDLDGPSSIISMKCKSCHRLLQPNKTICESEQCHLAFSLNYSGDKFERFFNINIHCSDHTGTLVEPRLSGAVAEHLFGLNVDEFLQCEDQRKEQLKWRFLMQHFELKVVVKRLTAVRRSLAIVIVNMRPVELEEICQKILVF